MMLNTMNGQRTSRYPFSGGLCLLVTVLIGFSNTPAHGGTYLDSAHGSTSYGVNRSSTSTLGYGRGNCAHCHENHASIEGNEPEPAGGSPSAYLLFADNFVDQTDDVCFDCHDGTATVQLVYNRSYSYRAGDWSDDTVNDILEAFSYTSPASSHNLADIKTFITAAGQSAWGYNSSSNPCVACHNPHAAQGDPANASDSAKSSGTRGWPVSRPSEHANSPWGLWGDGASEKMNNYTTNYQAPYLFGSTTTYEPDGSATVNGSNLTDFNTFCTDCHNTTNVITSTALGTLKKINWTGTDAGALGADIHGQKKGRDGQNNKGTLKAPYNEASLVDITLSCLDCHEPHGSNNAFLLRQEVNGVAIGLQILSDNSNGSVTQFCQACHNITGTTPGDPCTVGLHGPGPAWATANCLNNGCHQHGNYGCEGQGYSTF
jgi:predicted CXXCH cytochrome family protein